MNQQAPAGWYPDGRGNQRYWDGAAWTEHVHSLAGDGPVKKSSAFSKIGAAVKNAAAEKRALKEARERELAEHAQIAGALTTSGVFGTSTIEIYENGYVRVASWGENMSPAMAKGVDDSTPFERLRSISFTPSGAGTSSGSASGLEGMVGPAVAKLVKGGGGLMRASAPGMAAAGIAHIASNAARKSYLTVATDQKIHTLTNQRSNSVGLKSSERGHDDVGRALEKAGNAVLGLTTADAEAVIAAPISHASPNSGPPVGASPTLSERLRELAELHREGILSDEEFAGAKAKLISGL